VARQSPVDQRVLIDLLCTDMTESERAKKLEIARSSYYAQLDKLAQAGIIRTQGTLPAGMTCEGAHPRSKHSSTHHAPVMHVRWEDEEGLWGVQGALLDSWDKQLFKGPTNSDIAVVIRWREETEGRYHFNRISFVVVPRGSMTAPRFERETKTRWSTRDTLRNLSISWAVSHTTLERLTIAIARVLHTDALLIPEGV
jgi:hypothetical protein